MRQRLRGRDRIKHQAARVTVGVDTARHGGIARIELRDFFDARQAGRLGLAPAARAVAALKCLHPLNPAFGIKLQLPDQRRGLLRLHRCRHGLATERGDRRQRIAPGFAGRAKKRRRIGQPGLQARWQGRWCRHNVETHAGLLHQLGEPVAARRYQRLDHARDAVRVPSCGSGAKPGSQQQAVCSIDPVASVQVLPVHLRHGQRVFVDAFITEAHAGRMGPAAPRVVGRRFARARFGDAEFSCGAPGLRRRLGQQGHRVDPRQSYRHRATPRFDCALVGLVGGGKAIRSFNPTALHCRLRRHKHLTHGRAGMARQCGVHARQIERMHALLGNPVTNLQRDFPGGARGPGADPLIERCRFRIARQRVERSENLQPQGTVHTIKQERQEGRIDGIQQGGGIARRMQGAVEQARVGPGTDAAVDQQPQHGSDLVRIAQMYPARQLIRCAVAIRAGPDRPAPPVPGLVTRQQRRQAHGGSIGRISCEAKAAPLIGLDAPCCQQLPQRLRHLGVGQHCRACIAVSRRIEQIDYPGLAARTAANHERIKHGLQVTRSERRRRCLAKFCHRFDMASRQ